MGLTVSKVRVINSDYVATGQDTIIIATASLVLTMPPTAGLSGVMFWIKNNTTNGIVQVVPFDSQTINNQPFQSLSPNNVMQLVSDESNWHII